MDTVDPDDFAVRTPLAGCVRSILGLKPDHGARLQLRHVPTQLNARTTLSVIHNNRQQTLTIGRTQPHRRRACASRTTVVRAAF